MHKREHAAWRHLAMLARDIKTRCDDQRSMAGEMLKAVAVLHTQINYMEDNYAHITEEEHVEEEIKDEVPV